MKNWGRKFVIIVIALFILLAMYMMPREPVSAYSSTDVKWTDGVSGGSIYFDEATGTITDCDKSVTKIVIPSAINGVKVIKIGESAFSNCEELTDVSFPDSMISIGDDAFSGCSELYDASFLENVKYIGNCAFFGCSNLNNVIFSDGLKEIGSEAFAYCSSIKDISIPKGTIIESSAFYNCSNMQSIYFLDRQTEDVTRIGSGAFECCGKLQQVYINNIQQWCEIQFEGDYSNPLSYSKGCLYLMDEEKVIELSIPTEVKNINSYAFDGCSSIKSIVFQEGITSIGYGAFKNCSNLESVTIPETVTVIDGYAFNNCTELKAIFYSGTKQQWENINIIESNNELKTAQKHYNGCNNLNHKIIATVESTCSEKGYTEYSCECGSNIYRDFKDVLEHTEVVDNKVDPSCITVGLTEGKHCSVCGKVLNEQNEIPALGHDYIEHEEKPATCTEDGWKTYNTCSRCDYTTYEAIPALGHDYVEHEGKAATCTEKGWKAYKTCSRCDYTTYEEVPALGHDYVEHEGKAATCTEKGWKAYKTCSRCDYTTYEEVPALWHDYVEHEAKAATCEAKGWKAYKTCSRCDYTTYEEISALGHDYVDHEEKAATCTEKGWKAYKTCSRCDYTTYEEISALGHYYVEHEAKAATCEEKGWRAYKTCSRCDYTTYEEVPALGHDYIDHEGKEATCEEKGFRPYKTCSRCDYTTYEEISALGHAYVEHEAKAATCEEKGWKAYKTCSRCNYSNFEEVLALGHAYVEHEGKAATCTEDGWKVYQTCSRCDYTTYEEIPALGHDYVDHEGKEPTYVEAGWKAYQTCNRCDYTTYEEIPARTQTDISGIEFELSEDQYIYNGKEKQPTVSANGIVEGKDYIVSYEENVNVGTGKVIITGQGEYAGKLIKEFSIMPADLEGISVHGYEGVYDECLHSINIEGVPEDAEILYKMEEDEEYYSFPCEFAEVGEYTVFYKIDAGKNYNVITGSAKVIIKERSIFTYEINENNTVTITGFYDYPEGELDLIIPNAIDGYDVVEIANEAFCGHDGITSVIIQDGITRIGSNAFSWCDGIKSIKIPESVEDIGNSAFEGCDGLEQVNLPKKLKRINECLFYSCSTLKNVDISEGIISIGNSAFEYCESLEIIRVPNSVISIGEDVFYGCTELKRIEIPASVISIEDSSLSGYDNLIVYGSKGSYIEEYCSDLCLHFVADKMPEIATFISMEDVNVDEIPLQIYNGGDITPEVVVKRSGELLEKNKDYIIDCEIIDSSYKENKYHAKAAATIIGIGSYTGSIERLFLIEERSIAYNDGIIGGNIYFDKNSGTITSCDKTVTSVQIPEEIDGIKVVAVGKWAFSECESLISVTIPNTLTTINDFGFTLCRKLKTVKLPDSILTIGEDAFAGCNSLSEIKMSKNLTYIGSCAFDSCNNLKSIEIPKGVTIISEFLLVGCTSLEQVIIPESVSKIEEYAFSNCTNLKSIVLPDKITCIMDGTFFNCRSLNCLRIPSNVVSVGFEAFAGCSNLNMIEIPQNVNSIEEYAFDRCNDFIIYCEKNSYAEDYAKNNNISFVLDKMPLYIDNCIIYGVSAQVYLGKEINPDFIIKDGTYSLIQGVDYTVEYRNNINVGTATTIIKGIGNYHGELELNYEIKPQEIKDDNVSGIQNQTYTGNRILPSVSVTCGSKILQAGTDYKVNYGVNQYPGIGSVTVEGVGNYTGIITKTFNIAPPDLDAPAKVTVNLYGYDDLKASWNKVSGATGYYVYYKKSTWSSYEKLGSTMKLSYSKANLVDGARYSFRVYPYVKINGQVYVDKSYRSSEYVYTLKKLNRPVVKKSSKYYVRVLWNNIPGETGYEIARSKYSTKKFLIVKRVSYKYKSTTIKTPRNVKYYYKVRAYKTVAGKRIYGPWSSVYSYRLK